MKKIILLILMSFMSVAGYSQLPLPGESFEGATFPPAGWLVTDNGVGTAENWKLNAPNPPYTAYEPAPTDNAAFLERQATPIGVAAEEWLITNQVNVLANRQLRFFTRQTVPGDQGINGGTRYQIRVSTNATQANLGAYTIIADYSETDLSTETASQIDYEEKVINLAVTGNVYIAFVAVHTQTAGPTSGDRWLVDAVKIVQRCVEPTGLNVDGGVTCTSALLGWAGPAGATYNVEYGVSGFTPGIGEGTVVTGIAGTTFNLTGLNASTDYQFYVTAVCGSLGSSSEQTGPFNFSTITLGSLCSCPLPVPTLPFSECNDTAIFGNNITNGSPGTGCGGTAGSMAGNDVVYSYTVPATTTGFISISLNPNGATNTSLFVYNSCANIGISCIGGISNATSNIREITALAVTAGQTIFIVVSSTAATATFPYCLIIQDVNCVPPTNLGLTTPPPANPTTTEALLKWTNGPGGVSTSWQVVVQAAGSPIPSFAGVTTTNNLTFPGSTAYFVAGVLTPGLPVDTALEFWVRGDCNNGTFSAWSGPFQFNTLPTCPKPTVLVAGAILSTSIAISFTNNSSATEFQYIILTTGSPAPTVGSTGFTIFTTTSTIIEGLTPDTCYDIYVRANCGPIDGFSQWVPLINVCTQIAPPVCGGTYVDSGGSAGNYASNEDSTVTICPTNPGDLVTVTFTAFNTEANWDGLLVYDGNSVGAPLIDSGNGPGNGFFATNPGAYWGNTIPGPFTSSSLDGCLTFHFVSDGIFEFEGFIADVTCAPAPPCPKSTTLAAGSIGMTSAEISWVSPGNATSWQLYVVTAGSPAPTDTTTPTFTTSTQPFIITGLTAGTCYDVYVRNDCGPVDGISLWSTSIANFCTTICDPIDQCTYTFTMQDTFGDSWNGNIMTVSQGPVVVATLTGPTNADGTNPITQTVQICNDVPFTLTWSTAGAFTNEVRISITNSFSQVLYDMNTPSGNLAGTVLYSGVGSCDFPDCLPPTGAVASNITTNGVTLNWTASGAPIGYEIYVGLAGDPPPAIGTPPTVVVPGTATTYTLTTLLADVCYDIYVHALCTENSPSPWTVIPVNICTLPTCPKPINLLVSGITDDGATFNWTEAGPGISWEVQIVPSPSTLPLPVGGWIPVAATTYVASGLDAGVIYDFYVRAICPGNDIGQPAGPLTFNTTICDPIEQCNYTFILTDTFGDGWNGAEIEVRQNGIVVGLLGPTFTDGEGPITVTVPMCHNVPFDLFWATAGNFPGEISVQVVNSFSQTLFTMPPLSAALVGTILYNNTVDCLTPECFSPTDVAVVPGIFDAVISWTALPTLTYNIFVLPAGSTPPVVGDTPQYTSADSPFTIPTGDLTQLTGYDVYVQSVCPGGPANLFSPLVTFTTLPTCPAPINLTAANDDDSAILSWTPLGPATQWIVTVQLQGGTPIPGTPVTVNTPSYDTTPLGPLLAGFYEFFVQAVCTPEDSSTVNGPEPFYISPPPPVCADVAIPIETNPDGVLNFCAGDNTQELSAIFTDTGDTTSYGVLPIAFVPPFPFTGGIQLPINTDDIWSAPFTLPFQFCFYGVNYSSINVGSNGVLTFEPQAAGDYCPWPFTETIPNAGFPILNAIYGVYQDLNPNVATPVEHSINYQVLGTQPCRTFVVNYFNVAQFSCNLSVGLQTSQIVLYETSNIIEVYVQDRTTCIGWNDGNGVIGIQNAGGTEAVVPPGRNTGSWEAHNEAWRFTPSGPSNVTFSWLQDGDFLSNDPNITVNFNTTTLLTAQAVYTGCGGITVTETDEILLQVNPIDIGPIADVVECTSYDLPVLPNVTYWTLPGGPSTPDNVQLIDPITFVGDTTVYAYAATETIPVCTDEEAFIVTIGDALVPPLPDATDCVSFTLPDLTDTIPGFTGNYYTGIDGTGTMYLGTGGDVITTSGTMYIYVVNGACVGQDSFEINIGPPIADDLADVSDCNGFILPDFSNPNNTYWTLPGGPDTPGNVQLFPADNIAVSQTVYIWASNGTGPGCTAETDFVITIDSVIPTFDPIPNICLDAVPPALPPTSLEGIIGVWSPVVINTTVAGTFTYTFSPDITIVGQECAVETTLDVTIIDKIVPAFTLLTDICLNGTAPLLPTTDSNGIIGTWTPSIIDTSTAGTVTATFTPDTTIPTQSCAVPLTVTFNINSEITPTFTPIANICQNAPAPVLPTTSLNGVTGIWSCVIDTSVAGTTICTFTPDSTVPGQECAVSTTLSVTVDPGLTPTFTPIADICLGGAAPTLPLLSLEGIAGTWSPAIIDTSVAGTVTYTFTPTITICTINATLDVTIIAPLDPGFNDLTICSGDVAPILAPTSPTGVNGTWSPSVIDNTNGGTYVFTPDVGQCALSDSIVVSVTPQTTPDFPVIGPLCSGSAAPQLGSTSPNGVSGTWSPASIDTLIAGVFSYTFTPNTGSCATSQTLSVTIIQSVTPTFDVDSSYCSGDVAEALPTTSLNGVLGTWNPATINNTQSGSYTFTPDAGQPCAATIVLNVTVDDLPVFLVTGACNGNNYVLSVVQPNNLASSVTYSWSNDAGPIANADEATLIITATGNYTLSVSNGGCSSTQSIAVSSVACTIQKGISPIGINGGDGKNDYFDLEGRNVRKLEIFNRYGTEVYSMNNYSNQWYGQSDKGEELPDGTYYYMIEYNYATDPVTGWIYINREQ